MSDILIIGGGVAGLTAGIYSLLDGHSVTICEQHRITGGCLSGWNRNGYHIDNCIHWLTGTNQHSDLNHIWRKTGALNDEIKILSADKLYTFEKDGKSLSLWRDANKMQQEMLALEPESEKLIKDFIKGVKAMMYLNHTGGENFDSSGSLANKIAAAAALKKFGKWSVDEYGAKFKTPVLQEFFKGLTGSDFSMAAYVFVASTYCADNANLPDGGSFPMAKRMTDKFVSLGGVLKTGKKAVKINLEGNTAKSVTFEDGDTIAADKIIVALDPAAVFGKILDKPMPKKFAKLYADKATYKRFSALHAAFAVDACDVPFKATKAVCIPEDLQKTVKSGMCLIREFSHEKTYYPEGKNIIQTLIYQDEELCKQLIALHEDKEAYAAEKDKLLQAQMEIVERTVPELKGKLTPLDCWTPASYHRYIGSDIGSFMTFKMAPRKPMFVAGSKSAGVKNLYMATQWQLVPGGLPMAALSGRMAAAAVKK